MADIVKIPAVSGQSVKAHRVYAKVNWADSWDLKSFVYCNAASFASSPSVGRARLYYRFGVGRRAGENRLGVVNMFTLPTLAFVKIELDVFGWDSSNVEIDLDKTAVLSWFGVAGQLIDETAMANYQLGSNPNELTPLPSGYQTFNCLGLEWLLDRQYIVRSIWYDGSNAHKIDRAMDFNAGGRGNRTGSQIAWNGNVYLFAEDADSDTWSTRDIIQYLVAVHSPVDKDQNFIMKWELHDPNNLLPTWDKPVVRVHGRRVREIINALVTRHRGLGWKVEIHEPDDPPNTRFRVTIFSYALNDVVLPSGTLKKNQDQILLDVDETKASQQLIITDAQSKYDQVRIRGAAAQYVFSVSFPDSTLEKGNEWTTAKQTSYEQGASTDPGYPASTEIAERQFQNNLARMQPDLSAVFRRFRVPGDWDVKTKDGQNGGAKNVAIPIAGDEANELRVYVAGLRVLSTLPLQLGDDYSVNASNPTIDPAKEFERPFMVFEDPSHSNFWIDTRYIQVQSDNESDADTANYQWSATVEPAADELGFDLQVENQHRHVIAGRSFSGLTEDPDLGDFRYQTAIATIAVEGDQFCEALEPAAPGSTSDYIRGKFIQAGDQFQLHHVAKSAIVGVNKDGTLKKRDASGYVRDDRDELKDLAKAALTWYQLDRKAFRFSTHLLNDAISVGMLVQKFVNPGDDDDVTVNSVVTLIEINIPISNSGQGPAAPMMTYSSQNVELDVLQFVKSRRR